MNLFASRRTLQWFFRSLIIYYHRGISGVLSTLIETQTAVTWIIVSLTPKLFRRLDNIQHDLIRHEHAYRHVEYCQHSSRQWAYREQGVPTPCSRLSIRHAVCSLGILNVRGTTYKLCIASVYAIVPFTQNTNWFNKFELTSLYTDGSVTSSRLDVQIGICNYTFVDHIRR